ncbi:MAG: VOC family protein [Dehalococcoidia bacterium]|nr:VOC family protein [Dehalococcoidia bacterium]
MARSVAFYRALGFALSYGGAEASFTSLEVGRQRLNLEASAERPDPDRAVWGRVIIWVSDVDALYERAVAYDLEPAAPPRDAEWGERYFHLRDPDGHELSFARPLRDGVGHE